MPDQSYDIIIVGGGIVGLTLALLLGQGTTLSILVLEKNGLTHWQQDTYDHRVSAITLSSKHIFQYIDLWPEIKAKRISAFTKIAVWDKQNPSPLYFDSSEINEAYLGFIIENNLLQTELQKKISTLSNIKLIHHAQLKKFHAHLNHIEISTTDNNHYTARLAIAADGANSWLRKEAHISIKKHDYQEQAIVTQVITEASHHQTARQVFLETGPLAFLPLNEANLSSIVWTLPVHLAQEYINLSPGSFTAILSNSFPYLGKILSIDACHVFNLYKQHSKQYINQRVILIGDAAHTIHPLAGLGVNMGLLDAAVLFDEIREALRHGKDFSSFYYLRRYERSRRADNTTLMCGIDLVKYFYHEPKAPLKFLFSYALKYANHFPWIKNYFSTYAAGKKFLLARIHY